MVGKGNMPHNHKLRDANLALLKLRSRQEEEQAIENYELGVKSPKSLALYEKLIREHDKRVGLGVAIVYMCITILFILITIAYGSAIFLIFVVGSLIGSLYYYRSYRRAARGGA